MKILVTGARGFIGMHLVKALKKQGHDVLEFDLPFGDDLTYAVKGKYDMIYHLAVLPLISMRANPQKGIDCNVKGSLNVLECARECGAKVIYSSASSVYGIVEPVKLLVSSAHGPDKHANCAFPVSEGARIQPVSVYGATKAAAEILFETYHRLYGLDYFIFRFTNVYGPGQINGVIPAFMARIKNGKHVIIHGPGTQERDFVYAEDVVHFLVRALEADKKNMAVNLGSGTATSIRELVDLCVKVSKSAVEVEYQHAEADERWGFSADITKLKDVFGEVPKTALEEGLKKTWIEFMGGE